MIWCLTHLADAAWKKNQGGFVANSREKHHNWSVPRLLLLTAYHLGPHSHVCYIMWLKYLHRQSHFHLNTVDLLGLYLGLHPNPHTSLHFNLRLQWLQASSSECHAVTNAWCKPIVHTSARVTKVDYLHDTLFFNIIFPWRFSETPGFVKMQHVKELLQRSKVTAKGPLGKPMKQLLNGVKRTFCRAQDWRPHHQKKRVRKNKEFQFSGSKSKPILGHVTMATSVWEPGLWP